MFAITVFTFILCLAGQGVDAQGPWIPEPLPEVTPPDVVNLFLQNAADGAGDLVASVVNADATAATYQVTCNPEATGRAEKGYCGYANWASPIIVTQGANFMKFSYTERGGEAGDYLLSESCTFAATTAATAICTNSYGDGQPPYSDAFTTQDPLETVTYDGKLVTIEMDDSTITVMDPTASAYGPPPFIPVKITAGLEKLKATSGVAASTGSVSSVTSAAVPSITSAPNVNAATTSQSPTSTSVQTGGSSRLPGASSWQIVGLSSLLGLGALSRSPSSALLFLTCFVFSLFTAGSAQFVQASNTATVTQTDSASQSTETAVVTSTAFPSLPTLTPFPSTRRTGTVDTVNNPATLLDVPIVSFAIGGAILGTDNYRLGDVFGSIIAVDATATTYDIGCDSYATSGADDATYIRRYCPSGLPHFTIAQGPSTIHFSQIDTITEEGFTNAYTRACTFTNTATVTCSAEVTQLAEWNVDSEGVTFRDPMTYSESTTWTWRPENTTAPWIPVQITAGLEKLSAFEASLTAGSSAGTASTPLPSSATTGAAPAASETGSGAVEKSIVLKTWMVLVAACVAVCIML
ncbi:hypothetical protein B0O99DRAFT_195495 [Bisporella sp. PMI_857]|nr:hypothetical protein B0O99DRAFT_195495 [Bisporella sp. PMI_857]